MAAAVLDNILSVTNTSAFVRELSDGFADGPLASNATSTGPRSYYDIYGLYFVGVGVAVVISIIGSVYWAIRRRASLLSILPLYVIYISLGDFISDFTFIAYMPRDPPFVDALRKASIVFVMGASLINVAVVAAYIWWCLAKGGPKFEPFRRWLQGHKGITGFLLFLSLTSARILTLMYSSLFEMTTFSAPLPLSAIEVLELIGTITVILEDVPQLIVTCVISTYSNTWDSVAFTALAFSIVSVAISVGCRLIMLNHVTDEQRQRDDSFNPEYLKAHKAYRKGSARTLKHMYDSEEMGRSPGGLLRIESRMPEQLAAALRAIGADLHDEVGSGKRAAPGTPRGAVSTHEQLQPHEIYSAVSVPPAAPRVVVNKRRASFFMRASDGQAGDEDDPGATMAAAYAALAAAGTPTFEPGKYILAAAQARQLASMPTGRPPDPSSHGTAGSGEAPDEGPPQEYAPTPAPVGSTRPNSFVHNYGPSYGSLGASGDTGGTALDEMPEAREAEAVAAVAALRGIVLSPARSAAPSNASHQPSLDMADATAAYNPFRRAVELATSPPQLPSLGEGPEDGTRPRLEGAASRRNRIMLAGGMRAPQPPT